MDLGGIKTGGERERKGEKKNHEQSCSLLLLLHSSLVASCYSDSTRTAANQTYRQWQQQPAEETKTFNIMGDEFR